MPEANAGATAPAEQRKKVGELGSRTERLLLFFCLVGAMDAKSPAGFRGRVVPLEQRCSVLVWGVTG
jgi:hypothetical protein